MIPSAELVKDHAEPILRAMPLSDFDRGNLWQAYHEASDATSLARSFEQLQLPRDIAEPLIQAKRLTTPKGAAIRPEHELAMRPVLRAIEHIGKMSSAELDLAERNPMVFRHYMQMAVR